MNIFSKLLIAICCWFIFYLFEVKIFDWQLATSSVFIQTLFCWIYFMLLAMIFYPKQSTINIDFSGTFRHREIGLSEDILRELLFTKKGILSLILALLIGKSSVAMKDFFVNKKQESSTQVYQKQEQVSQSQDSYSQNNNTNSNQKNYYYSKDKDNYQIRKDDNGVIEYQVKDGSWISEAEAIKQLDQKNIYQYYNSSVSWDNLSAGDDEYVIVQKMGKNVNYIEEEGFFVRSSTSLYYYPHFYVDGFDKDQEFFYQFFKVEIISMSLSNGQTRTSTEMELSDYVNLIRSGDVVNGNHRHVKFIFKDKFKNKYSWHIIDAGFGNGNSEFKICFEKDCRYSLNEKNRLNIN